MNGWIKLHRQLDEWEWADDPFMVALFTRLLILANFQDAVWKDIRLHRGQVVVGLHSLSAKTGISIQRLRTCLSRLERSGEIIKKSTNKFTILTICNYTKYQDEKECEQQTSNKPATNQQQQRKKLRSKEVTTTANAADDFRFMEFWTRYPRKVNRPAAFKAWKKKNCGNGLFKEVMEGLDRYLCGPWKGKEKQFIPHGSSWINGERWNDEIDTGLSETCFVDCGVCKYNQDPNFPCRNLFCDTFDHSTCKSFRTVGDA